MKYAKEELYWIALKHYIKQMGKVTKRTGRGGPRKGAGRKPAIDPKIAVTIYVEDSIIKSMGGIEGVREECYNFLKSKSR